MADHVTNRVRRDKRRAPGKIGRLSAGFVPSAHVRRTRQQLPDLNLNTVAVDDHRALGDRQIVGKDLDGVFFPGVEFDDGAAAESQHLMDRHMCSAENDCYIERDLVECGHVSHPCWPRDCGSLQVTMVWLASG